MQNTTRSPSATFAPADLRALVDVAPALISFFDAEHVCRYANAHHLEWYGRAPESLIGLHMRDFLGDAGYASRAPHLARVATGESVAFDAQVPHRDGAPRDAAIRYIPKHGAGGFEGFYILVFDVARRKRELAEMLDLAHDAIVVRNLDGVISFWNRGCESLYGIDRKDALGREIDGLLTTAYPTQLATIQAELVSTGHWEGELQRQLADGTERIIATRWSLRRDEAGAPMEVLESGRDVTEARRAEEFLRRSEYRFRNVFDALAVSFWELDFTPVGAMLRQLKAAGVQDFRKHFAAHPHLIRTLMEHAIVVDVNEKTCYLFGGSREEILGPVARFWPRSSEPVFEASVLASIEKRPSIEAETRFVTLDGREIDCLFTCCFPREGLARGLILVGILDISDRLKAQDALTRARADLAHAARVSTLGELTASIAHEVNQPLAAVVTNGEAALRWLRRPEPDLKEVSASVERMIGEAQRASDIIARTRALATRSAPTRTALPLAPLIETTALLLKRELATHDIRLRISIPTSLPPVRADAVQIQQVLINLGMNAIQAMAHADCARRDLEICACTSDGSIQISVIDTGPGIAPDVAGRVFDAFVSTKSTGMGMGLSICSSIVEQHDGRMWVEPNPEGGAAFHFTLPSDISQLTTDKPGEDAIHTS